eukprot:NODE_1_length_95616_cov_0.657642.p62 type:complete len:170 gc:universal NODE_1_length_95616_cov_0.657642:47057-47566(+)
MSHSHFSSIDFYLSTSKYDDRKIRFNCYVDELEVLEEKMTKFNSSTEKFGIYTSAFQSNIERVKKYMSLNSLKKIDSKITSPTEDEPSVALRDEKHYLEEGYSCSFCSSTPTELSEEYELDELQDFFEKCILQRKEQEQEKMRTLLRKFTLGIYSANMLALCISLYLVL